jgi:hypothetical protein
VSDLLKVLKLAGRLAPYVALLPALLDLLDEVKRAGVDRKVSVHEAAGIGDRVCDLLRLVPR